MILDKIYMILVETKFKIKLNGSIEDSELMKICSKYGFLQLKVNNHKIKQKLGMMGSYPFSNLGDNWRK